MKLSSSQSGVDVENAWNFTSTPPICGLGTDII